MSNLCVLIITENAEVESVEFALGNVDKNNEIMIIKLKS